MKNKLLNFFVAMGIPVSVIGTQSSGCTGMCGSCSYNCTPGLFALLFLAAKAVYKNLSNRVMQHE